MYLPDMRHTQRLLLLVISCVALRADPVAITWTAPATILSSSCPGCSGTFTPSISTMDGSSVDLQAGYYDTASAYGAGSQSVIEAQFTLSSAADIMLVLTVTDSVYGNTCNPGACYDPDPTWMLDADFAGSATITGPGGFVVPFQDSTSVVSSDCNGYLCEASLLLTDAASGTNLLQAGTYTLTLAYQDGNSASGESWDESIVNAVLTDPPVAAPEPGDTAMMIAMTCLLALVLYRILK
jgi:hypothetical protein